MAGSLQEGMNEQVNHELYSAYLYLSMAAYFEAKSLSGFAHWMKVQAREEVGHAMKFFDFLGDVGARVRLKAIPEPPTDFPSPRGAFEGALAHERKVSSLIRGLLERAAAEKDHAAQEFLLGFAKEQVEEERQAYTIVERLKLAGAAGAALLMMDRELASREE